MTIIEHLIESIDGYKANISGRYINITIKVDDKCFSTLTDYAQGYLRDVFRSIIHDRLPIDVLNSLMSPYISRPMDGITIKQFEDSLNSYDKKYISKGGLDLKEELYLRFNLNRKFMSNRYNLK
jgi:hypothetical protein